MAKKRPARRAAGSGPSRPGSRTARRRPAARQAPAPPPASSPLRRRVERLSYPLLLRLVRGRRWLIALVLATLLLAGLAAPAPVGVVALLAVTAVVGWLTYLSWPALAAGARAGRVLVLFLLAGATAARGAELF